MIAVLNRAQPQAFFSTKSKVMKQFMLLLAALAFSVSAFAQGQQTPLYLLFNSSCMNQLEYRYAYSGASVISYSFMANQNKLYVLNSGNSGINSPTLPSGTIDCREIKLDGNFLEKVNKFKRQVYMVHQTQQGYQLMPIISAMSVERTGSYYFFRDPNFSFALDTTNLVYQANLATSGSANYVYFNGLNIRQCMHQYSFKAEPIDKAKERSDFEFIPGVGMVSSRSGMNATDMEKNQLRLWFVNGLALEDYLTTVCTGKTATMPPAQNPMGFQTPTVNDKETSPIPTGQPPAIANQPVQPGVGNCPTPPGPGYHVVQPKETLMAISRTYGVSVKSLVRWNNISNPNLINPCQKVFVQDPTKAPSGFTSAGPGPKVESQAGLWNQPPAATTAPPTSGQTAKSVTNNPPGTRMVPVHVVKVGESVSSIARLYGCTEAEFRRINYMATTGNVTIFPGQQLFVSGCAGSTTSLPATQPGTITNPGGNNLQPLEHNTGQPGTMQPVTHSQFIETSVVNNPNNTNNTVRKPTYYQEYVVQQGETMNSIAIKFKTSTQELALLNNKEANEVLVPGQRILIPKQ